MPPIRRVVLIFMLMHCLNHSTTTTTSQKQQHQLAKREVPRGYKYLVFPQGSNVQLVYCLTVASLGKPQGLFTFGVTAGLAYELPHRATVAHRRPAEVYHRRSRRQLYGRIESLLRTRGHTEPRACLLRALCEAGHAARNNSNNNSDDSGGKRSFQREILHSIFTYPEWSGEDVDEDDERQSSQQQQQQQQQNRLKALEYDKAYNAQDDCDKLFAVSGSGSACPLLRLLI
ncbi:hypothetical protein TKK_0003218 [Trichogramma kaykai]|uniref:Uncharacterized protein n=1 Tax=Trichogramma kaykai TaxID=54128 RepID=A0ABD2WTM7_9HYME